MLTIIDACPVRTFGTRRGARKNGLITQFVRDVDWGELEYLVVDSPPGTSDEHITLAKLMQGTEGVSAIIVTTPQEIALLDVRKVGSGLGFGD